MAELVAQSILEQFKLNGKTALTVGGIRGPVLRPALFLVCSFFQYRVTRRRTLNTFLSNHD